MLQETTRRKVMIIKGKILEEMHCKEDQSFPSIKILFIFMDIATIAINMVTRLPIVELMEEILKLKTKVCLLFKFNVIIVIILGIFPKIA
jgi:hypothetical protein